MRMFPESIKSHEEQRFPVRYTCWRHDVSKRPNAVASGPKRRYEICLYDPRSSMQCTIWFEWDDLDGLLKDTPKLLPTADRGELGSGVGMVKRLLETRLQILPAHHLPKVKNEFSANALGTHVIEAKEDSSGEQEFESRVATIPHQDIVPGAFFGSRTGQKDCVIGVDRCIYRRGFKIQNDDPALEFFGIVSVFQEGGVCVFRGKCTTRCRRFATSQRLQTRPKSRRSSRPSWSRNFLV